MGDERKIKSYGFNATVEYIHKHHDEATRQRIFASLSPGVRDFLAVAKRSDFAPPTYSGELWTALVKEEPGDAMKMLAELGRYQGAYATNTYLKLLMKMLTVKMFVKKFPDIWQRDANFGKVVVGNLTELDKGRLYLELRELGSYAYFGAVSVGWFAFSFEAMGLKNVQVQVVDWSLQNPDPGEVKYHVTWTP